MSDPTVRAWLDVWGWIGWCAMVEGSLAVALNAARHCYEAERKRVERIERLAHQLSAIAGRVIGPGAN